jgi:ubiquinone/menaquinone biosynthesis C-methylase UbiE
VSGVVAQSGADDSGAGTPPDAPVVAADEYDEDYYRTHCAGAIEWSESGGTRMSGIYHGVLELASFRAGETLVDLGTGRGELPALAATRGAAHAVGVEYSADAVRLAHQTVTAQGVSDRVEIVQADARSVPLPDAMADLVTMVDVAEHLAPAELDAALAEARRLLRPGGRLFVHTFPTRTLYAVNYRLLRAVALRRRWPRDPRNDYEHRLHINEQTIRVLRRTLRRAGFDDVDVHLGSWVYVDHLPDEWARRLVRNLGKHRGVSRFARSDIVAVARRR